MRAPTDAFFEKHVATTGGDLQEKLSLLKEKQEAALAEGKKKRLAEVARDEGLLEASAVEELAQAEAEAAPKKPSAAEPTPSKSKTQTASTKKPGAAAPTPSKTKTQTGTTKKPGAKPSSGDGPKPPSGDAAAAEPKKAESNAAAGEAAAEAAPEKKEPGAKTGAAKRGGATPSKKGIATGSSSKKPASPTPSGKTPSGKKRSAVTPAPANANNLLYVIAGGLVVVAVLVAVLIVVMGNKNDGQGPNVAANDAGNGTPPAPQRTTPPGDDHSPAPSKDPQKRPDATPSEAAPAPESLTPEEQKEREDLQLRAGEIIGFASGDEFGRMKALKMLSVLETQASSKNMDIVRRTKAKVNDLIQAAQRSAAKDQAQIEEQERERKAAEEAAKKQAEDDAKKNAPDPAKSPAPATPTVATAPTPEPAPPPNPSLLAYQDLRKKLDPAMAAFDFDKAGKVLGDAPELDGVPAKDLEDDKAAIPVLEKLVDYAGAPKAWKDQIELENQTFVLANGTKITGTLKKVENDTLTVFMNIGGLQDVKVSELVLKDVCAYARKGCPKEERGACFLGWALACYYSGDLDQAKAKLEESTRESGGNPDLAKRFLARMVRERILAEAQAGGEKPAKPVVVAKGPEKGPETPADPGTPKGPDAPAPDPSPTPGPDNPAPAPAANPDIAALKDLLHAATVSAEAGGKVAISYSCTQESMAEDWKVSGNANLGRPTDNWVNNGLYFGVSSSETAAIQHCLSWKGDFDWTIEFQLNNSISNWSAVMFVVDLTDNPRKPRGLLSGFGQTLAKFEGKAITPLGGANDPKSFVGGDRRNALRVVRKGDTFILYWNGSKRLETKMTGGEARLGLRSAGMPLWITKLEMHGVPDMEKSQKK